MTAEEFEKFREERLINRKKRTYRMVLHHREIQVECPVLMDRNRAVGVIMPAFKLPYRPYPCYVYLFAVALYLAGDSMRKAAGKVRKKFGIPGFSHSTISRVLSILLSKADLLSAVSEPDMLGKSLPGRPAFPERSAWTQEKKKAAFQLFKSLSPLLADPESGIWLVYRYFMRYCRLLM